MNSKVLLTIKVKPFNYPELISSYIINEKLFKYKYEHIFQKNRTIALTNSNPDYHFEIYLRDCKVSIIRDIDRINSFRLLFNANHYGNIDIFGQLDRIFSNYQRKRQRLTLTSKSKFDDFDMDVSRILSNMYSSDDWYNNVIDNENGDDNEDEASEDEASEGEDEDEASDSS